MAMATSETEARQELITHFGGAVGDHPDVMAECKPRSFSHFSTWHQLIQSRPIDTPVIQYRTLGSVLQIRSIRHVASFWLEAEAIDADIGHGARIEKGDSEGTSGQSRSDCCWISCA